MERLKVAIGVVIAVCLAKLAFGDALLPEARAQGGTVTCRAIYLDRIDVEGNKSDKAVLAAKTHARAVRGWLEDHPGEVVYQNALVNGSPTSIYGFVDVICVRS